MMIPIIDLQARNALDLIDKAYTTVGFAVFVNSLSDHEQKHMTAWFEKMKSFFDMSLDFKNKHEYKGGIPILVTLIQLLLKKYLIFKI